MHQPPCIPDVELMLSDHVFHNEILVEYARGEHQVTSHLGPCHHEQAFNDCVHVCDLSLEHSMNAMFQCGLRLLFYPHENPVAPEEAFNMFMVLGWHHDRHLHYHIGYHVDDLHMKEISLRSLWNVADLLDKTQFVACGNRVGEQDISHCGIVGCWWQMVVCD